MHRNIFNYKRNFFSKWIFLGQTYVTFQNILISSSIFEIELYEIPLVLVYDADQNRIVPLKLKQKLQITIKKNFTIEILNLKR